MDYEREKKALLGRGRTGSEQLAEKHKQWLFGVRRKPMECQRAYILFELFDQWNIQEKHLAVFPEFLVLLLPKELMFYRIWFRDGRVDKRPLIVSDDKNLVNVDIRYNPVKDMFCLRENDYSHVHFGFPKSRIGVRSSDMECTEIPFFPSVNPVVLHETKNSVIGAFVDIMGYPMKKACQVLGWPALGQRSMQVWVDQDKVRATFGCMPVAPKPMYANDPLVEQNPQFTLPWKLK